MPQRIMIADTETTGFGKPPKNAIVTFALVEIDHDLEVLGELECMVKPPIEITPGAAGVHGITNEMVADCPSIESVFATGELHDEDLSDVLLVCHNVNFDRPLLEPHMNVRGEFCTLRAVRSVYPEAPDHKLPTLRHWLKIDDFLKESGIVAGRGHGALADVYVTYGLIYCLLRDSGLPLSELMEDARKPLVHETMPWGIHKDKPLADVPQKYLIWLRSQDSFDKDVDASFKLLGR